MIFEWDENKKRLNVKNHDGIDFSDASLAIRDSFALEEYDDAHSTDDEKRYSCIGADANRILYVIYTVRETKAPKMKFTG